MPNGDLVPYYTVVMPLFLLKSFKVVPGLVRVGVASTGVGSISLGVSEPTIKLPPSY